MDPEVDLGELERAASTGDLLTATCRALIRAIGADACTISRVLGDLLINIAEAATSGESLHLGHGYLLTDFPVTAEVLERVEPRPVSLLEPDPDPGEAKVLEELGFDSVLMLPLMHGDVSWALVEVYVSGRPFGDQDVGRAVPIVRRAGDILTERLRAGRARDART
jgi:GAF domain-containing protein